MNTLRTHTHCIVNYPVLNYFPFFLRVSHFHSSTASFLSLYFPLWLPDSLSSFPPPRLFHRNTPTQMQTLISAVSLGGSHSCCNCEEQKDSVKGCTTFCCCCSYAHSSVWTADYTSGNSDPRRYEDRFKSGEADLALRIIYEAVLLWRRKNWRIKMKISLVRDTALHYNWTPALWKLSLWKFVENGQTWLVFVQLVFLASFEDWAGWTCSTE